MGGLGLTSAVRSRVAAHWPSWANCIKMIKDRHPDVANMVIESIDRDPAPCFQAVRSWERALRDEGLETPTWREMSESLPESESQPEPNGPKGWQHAANKSLEEQFHAAHWEELPPPDRAVMRSQRGPMASAVLTALLTCRATRIESQPNPRLVVSSPPSPRRLDKFGHHRAACSRVGVLGTRGFPLECTAAQVCKGRRTCCNQRADPRSGPW